MAAVRRFHNACLAIFKSKGGGGVQNYIKSIRIKKGLTQSEMAIATGITVRQYRRIEKGEQDPRTKTSILIVKALNTTVEELFPLSGI